MYDELVEIMIIDQFYPNSNLLNELLSLFSYLLQYHYSLKAAAVEN